MKTISIHSKKGMHFVNAYERSKATCLHDVYKTPSCNKKHAYYDCMEDANHQPQLQFLLLCSKEQGRTHRLHTKPKLHRKVRERTINKKQRWPVKTDWLPFVYQ